MPRISIIIATYNSERCIENTLGQILESEYKDFELIVVSDGSTDGTDALVEKHAKLADAGKIKLIKQENSGPGPARNAGIKHASGDYLLIIDDDDLLPDGALTAYAQAAESNPDIVVGGYIMKEDKLKTLFSMDSMSLFTHSSFLSFLPDIIDAHLGYITWNKLYKKSVVTEHNIEFTSYKSCEDRLFNLEFSKYIERAEIVSLPLYIYNAHKSGGLNGKFLEDRKASLDAFYQSLLSLYDCSPGKYAESIFAMAYVKGIYACVISTFRSGLGRKQKRDYIADSIKGENVKDALLKARPGPGALIPVLCLKSRSAALCTLCARLIDITDSHLHSLFMKLKHNKTGDKNV